MKYQAFLHHFVSVGGWLEGSWGGWLVVGGGVGGVLVRSGWCVHERWGGGVIGVLVKGGWVVVVE